MKTYAILCLVAVFTIGQLAFCNDPIASESWSLGKQNNAILSIANIDKPDDNPIEQEKAIRKLERLLGSRWEYQRSASMKAILSVALSTKDIGIHQSAIEALSKGVPHQNPDTQKEASSAIRQIGIHTTSPEIKTLAVAKLLKGPEVEEASKVTESLRNTIAERRPSSSSAH